MRRNLGVAAPPAEAPLVLIGREGRRRAVLAANMAALRAGLRVGMPVTKAQAIVKGLTVKDAEPVADADALERLALWALCYAPIVAADPPDGLVIDTTGAAHLHGGEAAMVKAMVERLTASGIAAHAALADSWGAAHGFARFVARPVVVIPPGESAKALLDLPIAALRLPNDGLDGEISEIKRLRERVCALCTRPFYFSFVFVSAMRLARTRRRRLSQRLSRWGILRYSVVRLKSARGDRQRPEIERPTRKMAATSEPRIGAAVREGARAGRETTNDRAIFSRGTARSNMLSLKIYFAGDIF